MYGFALPQSAYIQALYWDWMNEGVRGAWDQVDEWTRPT